MNTLFLLGGHDLEMLEIKKLLENNGHDVSDANLRWDNAYLDAYQDVLEQHPQTAFVGIELRGPHHLAINYHYTLIDHHNELSRRPASILQVAAMLSIDPDRRMLLVAANDSGYIPAMEALGATPDEITAIRQEDRRAQGITQNDEALAELSINEHILKTDKAIIVHSLTPRFPSICDRLYPYSSLLIYTDQEWVFYGIGKSEIEKQMAPEILSGRIYHGGGDTGYIGAAKRAFSPQEIKAFVSTFKQ